MFGVPLLNQYFIFLIQLWQISYAQCFIAKINHKRTMSTPFLPQINHPRNYLSYTSEESNSLKKSTYDSIDKDLCDGSNFDSEIELRSFRIDRARSLLIDALKNDHYTGDDFEFVGLGHEGVIFRKSGEKFKVFDQKGNTVSEQQCLIIEKIFKSKIIRHSNTLIVNSKFIEGESYRGGHGKALMYLLRWMKDNNLYHSNFSPDNVIIEKQTGKLYMIDFGRDIHQDSSECFKKHFHAMCMRAFLCFRFGKYANNINDLNKLKSWMTKTSYENKKSIPELSGFSNFWTVVNESMCTKDIFESLSADIESKNLSDMTENVLVCEDVSAYHGLKCINKHDRDEEVISKIKHEVCRVKKLSNGGKIDIYIENPFEMNEHKKSSLRRPLWYYRRPLWYYRRHLNRIKKCMSITEKSFEGIDQNRFEKSIIYWGFFVSTNHYRETENGNTGNQGKITNMMSLEIKQEPGCYLMIKSCALDNDLILPNVRRIVHTLERASSFKKILLVVDWSRLDGFLRQMKNPDIHAYTKALLEIEQERLVDEIIYFHGNHEGQELSEDWVKSTKLLNKKWLGVDDCRATHSEKGECYAATFFGFETIRADEDYTNCDVLLQMDSDILLHCDKKFNGILKVLHDFEKDKKLLTFAFPVLSKGPVGDDKYFVRGKPCRFEVRCCFMHLERLQKLLPLSIPEKYVSNKDNFCINKGWYRVLDENILQFNMKSCRGWFGYNKWFFLHPTNQFKSRENGEPFLLVADRISSRTPAFVQDDSLLAFDAWHSQALKGVDLIDQNEWFVERNERIVFCVNGYEVPYGRAMRCLESLSRQKNGFKEGGDCGLILVEDATRNFDDIREDLFEKAASLLGKDNISVINTGRRRRSMANLDHAIKNVCKNSNTIIVTLDLDDCLLGEDAIEIIRKIYGLKSKQNGGIQCAIGGMVRTTKNKQYPLNTKNPRTSRGAGNVWKHLRSFKKGLYDNIDSKDLKYPNGSYFDIGCDWAFMIPIVEQAGSKGIYDIDEGIGEAIYLYEESLQCRNLKHQELDIVADILRERTSYKSNQ